MQRLLVKTLFAVVLLALASADLFAGEARIVRSPDRIPGQYLVMLDDSVVRETLPEVASQVAKAHGGKLRFVMNNIRNIFSIEMTEAQVQALARNPLVVQIDEVAAVYPSAIQQLPPPTPLNWMDLWNLDRIDQWSTANSNQYQYCERARDVIAYVVDTGVMGDHQEFRRPDGTSRVRPGACYAHDCPQNRGDTICPATGGRSGDYTVSHGTAVASILGGRTVGVAKEISIVPIRIVACDLQNWPGTTTERAVQALNWIRSTSNPDRNHRPAVLNMSMYAVATDQALTIFEQAVAGLINDNLTPNPQVYWTGIPVIASANNQGLSDCVTSPARMAYRNNGFPSPARVVSVGASGRKVVNGVLTDVRWQTPMFDGETRWLERCVDATGERTNLEPGSNHGNMVDIYAPGHDVESAYTQNTASYRLLHESRSGTSFSAPVVVGIAARILQIEQSLTPALVWERVRDTAQVLATPLDTSGATPNHLLANRRYTSPTCSFEYP